MVLSFQEFSREQYEELMRYAKDELDIPMTASAMDEVYRVYQRLGPSIKNRMISVMVC